jgi:hypothetical protein
MVPDTVWKRLPFWSVAKKGMKNRAIEETMSRRHH